MSGPKSADYYLTPEQRRQLAEQRRVNELKKKIEKYSACCVYSQSALDEYSSNASELMKEISEDNGYSELSAKLDSVIKELKMSLADASGLKDSDSLSKCYDKLKKLNRTKESLISSIQKTDYENVMRLKEISEKKLESFMSTDFSDIKSKRSSELEEVLQQINKILCIAEKTPHLSEELVGQIHSASQNARNIEDISVLRNFRVITAETLAKCCNEYSEMYKEYEELFNEYKALCETENIPVNEFDCSRENIERIKALTEEIQTSAAKADEQEYISRSIDEVMTEMGYKLIGNRSVTKKSGRKFHCELYTFSEGTAVNITHSSNGQITMELAGIDSVDRQPVDDESNFLCSEMESFCGSFSEFEKKLAEKGVMSKHISILPPAPEYAQIINVNDYEINSNADYSEIKSNKRSGSEKSMRME